MTFRSAHTMQGFSCVFRQHHSTTEHQRLLQGHVLGFTFEFEATDLDTSKRVIDVEVLTTLDVELRKWYDRTMIVADDDPYIAVIHALHNDARLATVVMLDHISNEAFAKHAHSLAVDLLRMSGLEWRLRCSSVSCFERDVCVATYVPSFTNGKGI